MQDPREAGNNHTEVVDMRINAPKTKVMSGEQRPAVMPNGESLEEVEKLKYLGSVNVANGQGTDLSCPFRILSSAIMLRTNWKTLNPSSISGIAL